MDRDELRRGTAGRPPSPVTNGPEVAFDAYVRQLSEDLPPLYGGPVDWFDINALSMYPYLLVRMREAKEAYNRARDYHPGLGWRDNLFLAIAVHPMYRPGDMERWLDRWDGQGYWANELLGYARGAGFVDLYIRPFEREEPSLEVVPGLAELIDMHGRGGGETALRRQSASETRPREPRPRDFNLQREMQIQVRRPSRHGDNRPGRSAVWDEERGPVDYREDYDDQEPVPGIRRARRFDPSDRVISRV